MSAVADAITALKTALGDIDPSPADDPANIYEWPADRATIDYETFPFIICARALAEEQWLETLKGSVGPHHWTAEILICLAAGSLTREDVSAALEAAADPWCEALYTVLIANRGLGGNALSIGNENGLFTTRIGNIAWLDSLTFWGIYAKVPVTRFG